MRFELMFFLKPPYNVVDSLQRRLMTTERAISNTVSVNWYGSFRMCYGWRTNFSFGLL